MLIDLAHRNSIKIKYSSVQEIIRAYKFNNLQEFLDLYYAGISVLIHEQDFYDLTTAYLQKTSSQNVTHAEIFFDPQAHLSRGIKFDTVINGMHRAIEDAEIKFKIKASLIVCFLRNLSEKSAIETLELALNYREKFIGIGLDSYEIGNPPAKFKQLFKIARDHKLKLVAHAGEEGPAQNIWDAIDILGAERIDHGVSAISDPTLIKRLARDKIPLTMCPISNLLLNVVSDLKIHPVRYFLDNGVIVTINSDDPAYFNGYINENYQAIADNLQLTQDEVLRLIENSYTAKFV